MADKTYLQLVNGARRESGVTLDDLTSSNFSSPPEKIDERFKEWVNQAYLDILLENSDWYFRTRRATILINPRIHVASGDRSAAPPAASEFEGAETATTFTVIDTVTLSGDWTLGTAEGFLEIQSLDGTFKFNESFDETSPTPANTDVFRVLGWGRYDLKEEVSGLQEADHSSFQIQSTGNSPNQTDTDAMNLRGLKFINYYDWEDYLEEGNASVSMPSFFTVTSDGTYDFFPRPDKDYVLSFNYTYEPTALSAHGDTVTDVPEQFQDAIMWRAVMYWADFASETSKYFYAKRRHDFYFQLLEQQETPQFTFGANRYFRNG